LVIAIFNSLPVKEGAADKIVERFAESRGHGQGFPGFVSMEVLKSSEGDEVLVITRWENRASFDARGRKMEMQHGNRKAPIRGASVIEGTERADLHKEQAVESIRILDQRGYLDATYTNSTVPFLLLVTDWGFDEYARTFLPGYDALERSVGLEIVNHGAAQPRYSTVSRQPSGDRRAYPSFVGIPRADSTFSRYRTKAAHQGCLSRAETLA
jgi:heme-degrading monooxygenase HmoA